MKNVKLSRRDSRVLHREYDNTAGYSEILLPGGAKWYPQYNMIGGYAADGRDIDAAYMHIYRLRSKLPLLQRLF